MMEPLGYIPPAEPSSAYNAMVDEANPTLRALKTCFSFHVKRPAVLRVPLCEEIGPPAVEARSKRMETQAHMFHVIRTNAG
jgi:hypothetical protein